MYIYTCMYNYLHIYICTYIYIYVCEQHMYIRRALGGRQAAKNIAYFEGPFDVYSLVHQSDSLTVY